MIALRHRPIELELRHRFRIARGASDSRLNVAVELEDADGNGNRIGRGEAAPTSELAFRVITEQLPINLQRERQGGAQVTLLLRYEGTLYVAPPNATADVAVDSAESITDDAGAQKLRVTVSNTGTRHAILCPPRKIRRETGLRADAGAGRRGADGRRRGERAAHLRRAEARRS